MILDTLIGKEETPIGDSPKQGKFEGEVHIPEEDGHTQLLIHLCHDGIIGCL